MEFYSFLDYYRERYNTHNKLFDTKNHKDFYAILDGQQRITSLYLALFGHYDKGKRKTKWQSESHIVVKVEISFSIDCYASINIRNEGKYKTKAKNKLTIYVLITSRTNNIPHFKIRRVMILKSYFKFAFIYKSYSA